MSLLNKTIPETSLRSISMAFISRPSSLLSSSGVALDQMIPSSGFRVRARRLCMRWKQALTKILRFGARSGTCQTNWHFSSHKPGSAFAFLRTRVNPFAFCQKLWHQWSQASRYAAYQKTLRLASGRWRLFLTTRTKTWRLKICMRSS